MSETEGNPTPENQNNSGPKRLNFLELLKRFILSSLIIGIIIAIFSIYISGTYAYVTETEDQILTLLERSKKRVEAQTNNSRRWGDEELQETRKKLKTLYEDLPADLRKDFKICIAETVKDARFIEDEAIRNPQTIMANFNSKVESVKRLTSKWFYSQLFFFHWVVDFENCK
ncbi:hypothetical protein [Lentilitoribacter sp. EG35]|uniref:hypothetical protein n=1 Tax=Lentilitoribacter sp. EG35 TaxID=3234192 RepID=UPI0034609F95